MKTRDQLLKQAANKLEAFRLTGCKGFFQQAKDRINAAGINVDTYTPADAEILRDYLRLYWHV